MKTERIKVDFRKIDKTVIKKAASIIKSGGLVAFPTETVYGLGADYFNKEAIDKLYEIKKRPKNKPFTIHIAKVTELTKLSCEISHFSKELIEKFWPGPLTIIFSTESGEKIGIRMPRNKIALEFISLCGTAVVAPSANISGRKPPRDADDVLKDLDGKIDLVLDGGKTDIGLESSIVDVSISPHRLMREGAIDKNQIDDIWKQNEDSLCVHRK
jgi:L-threonylcarbamoyladenylate synthase